MPPASDGQVGLRVVDLDKNGQNDYVLTLYSAAASVVWYRRVGDRFDPYVVATETPHLSHGDGIKDIDGDGDLDLLIADGSPGDKIYWWENPYPDFDPGAPWVRRIVRDGGARMYHDCIWGDFDGDGQDELIAWNEYGHQLLLFEIPANPKTSGPWPVTPIFSWTGDPLKYRGAEAVDINLDGKVDFVGGGGWFEHRGGTNFIYHVIDEAMGYSQIEAGQFIPGGRPELVCIHERRAFPLTLYEWTGDRWRARILATNVPASHTLQVGDVNLDGKLDIMTGEMAPLSYPYLPFNHDAKISVWYGDGTGNFTQQIVFQGLDNLEGQLTDMDNDGDLDIVIKPFRNDIPKMDIFINKGFAPTILPTEAAGASAPPLREYREYPSSSNPALKLFARFGCSTPTGILLVKMHGWHGQVKIAHSDNVPDPAARGYFVIEPEMRGRGDATGNPDCSGWELQDVIDAVEFARTNYHNRIESPQVVLLWGGSGGGGNAYALLGKFPDYFSAANVESGMSDYALWHVFDRKGEFRDEMEGVNGEDPCGRNPWIGGVPETNAEAYRSRGGLMTVGNLLTPTIVFHGADDVRVPALHARLWVGAAHGQGRGAFVTYHELAGVGDNRLHYANETKEQQTFRTRTGTAFLREHRVPPALPSRGRFVVAGYLKTSQFEVVLDSIDHVAQLEYDLPANRFVLRAATAKKATLRLHRPDGLWVSSELVCHSLTYNANR